MVVLILTAAPASLRGMMTRWLLEVAPGVFIGRLSSRVRGHLWAIIEENLGGGRAFMAWPAQSEQHFECASLGHDRTPMDVEGLTLMSAPLSIDGPLSDIRGAIPTAKEGWSVAGRRRRFGRYTERALGSH